MCVYRFVAFLPIQKQFVHNIFIFCNLNVLIHKL